MTDSMYFKPPVHEVVAVLPTDKAAGYRCILTTDPSKIYIYGADGTWTTDTNIGCGAMLSIIGINGDVTGYGRYANAPAYTNKRSPFFMSGNVQNITTGVYSGDDLYAIRRKADKTISDVVLYKSTGDTSKSASYNHDFVKSVTDSLGNIWIATAAAGLLKIEAGEKDMSPTLYSVANNNLPFDTITDIIADGIELWIVYGATTNFKIAHYDGNEWTDLTAQIESDLTATGLDCDNLTAVSFYSIFADADSVLFSLTDASVTGNLFYYDKTAKTFYLKALPSAFTGKYLEKFVKIGDTVYSLVNASAAMGGKLWVWSWANLTVSYTEATVSSTGITTDGSKIILWNATGIQSLVAPAYTPVNENTMEASILALLTSPATLNIVDIIMSANGRIAVLNAFDNKSAIISNVIEGVPTPQWVTSGI